MIPLNPSLEAEVIVAAVIARTRMPARSLAALQPGDFIETEPEIGTQPIVRLTVGTTTVALASIAKVEGRLIATILDNRSELAGRKGDLWMVRKPNLSTD
jgi:flagellar motor switch/type III secretory pathway protein FliN